MDLPFGFFTCRYVDTAPIWFLPPSGIMTSSRNATRRLLFSFNIQYTLACHDNTLCFYRKILRLMLISTKMLIPVEHLYLKCFFFHISTKKQQKSPHFCKETVIYFAIMVTGRRYSAAFSHFYLIIIITGSSSSSSVTSSSGLKARFKAGQSHVSLFCFVVGCICNFRLLILLKRYYLNPVS
ncbi:hypothetical protein NQD34_011465 [Periophthalmus magnuspinnatus]|nr:hypothetical protein NQD34_011465 [Periophthalmus magnuspinnatus]